MSVRSTRCAIALCVLLGAAGAAENEPAADLNGLQEVRQLSQLPPELAKTLGWEGVSEDTIANLERESGEPVPKSFSRWFLLGGMSKTYAVVAMEERASNRSWDRIHANAYSLNGASWVDGGEWILSSRPHTVDDLDKMLKSPESQTLTTRWRDWQRAQDLQRRIFESAPNRPNTHFRETNINDDEVRQIETVVRQLFPGAIVTISGVAQGCPCEDGPGCSAQVWTAVYRAERTRSLELSDINDQWVVGPVQRWYLESAELKRSNFPTYAAYNAAQAALTDRYPACAVSSSAESNAP